MRLLSLTICADCFSKELKVDLYWLKIIKLQSMCRRIQLHRYLNQIFTGMDELFKAQRFLMQLPLKTFVGHTNFLRQ